MDKSYSEQLVEACNILIDWALEQSAVMASGYPKGAILEMLNGLRSLVQGEDEE